MALSPTEIVYWSIYRIISPSNRVYIGITSDLQKRFSVYKSNAKSRQTLIFNSIKKYGFDAHQVDIIDTFNGDNSYAQGKEMFWIRSYMSHKNKYPEQNGLNLTDGGDGTRGYKQTQEAIEKSRQSKLGKKQSAETIEKRAAKQRGRKMNFTHMTPEFLEAMRERNRKYRHTDEAKKKIGDAARGNKYALGTKLTQSQKNHLSLLNKGRKLSGTALDEHIKRVRKACGKPILQFDLNNNFIKEYPMLVTAANEIGIPKLGIWRNVSGKHKQSRGFIFKYKQP